MQVSRKNKRNCPQFVKYVSGDHQENAKTKVGSDLERKIKTGGFMTSLPLRTTVVKIKKIREGGDLIN